MISVTFNENRFHIKFDLAKSTICKMDLTEEQLMERFVVPYQEGKPMLVNGAKILPSDVVKIRIGITGPGEFSRWQDSIWSESPDRFRSKELTDREAERVIDQLKDVTDDYITSIAPEAKDVALIDSTYVNELAIQELQKIKSESFDLSKLIQLCLELNTNWKVGNYFAVIALLRSLLDHCAPILGQGNFEAVANNYNGGKSFKTAMLHLQNTSRSAANIHLHSPVGKKEVLPNNTQVDFKSDLDILLSEIIKKLHN